MNRLKFLLALSLLSFSIVINAQEQIHYKFRIYLKDKGETNYSVDKPSEFLSREAIERKNRQKAVIDTSDFPISPDYFNLVEKAGGKVVSYSKWFKTLVVDVPDSIRIEQIALLPFVDSVKYVWRGTEKKLTDLARPRLRNDNPEKKVPLNNFLGATQLQFTLHNAEEMVRAGFQGKGMRVGVIDAGFTNFDVIPLFEKIRFRGARNFVPTDDIFHSSDHGTRVLSTMAVNQPNLMMGSAPEASYWLLRSEDAKTEFPVEEDYWVRAVEYADSIGLDIINTSLGYSTFDDPTLNYSHIDLTGKKSIMSLAADKAFEKGMLLVASAGNAGNKKWRKTTPPGDAKNMLTVGAVGVDSLIAPFSSRGYLPDGRIKPDVVSVGFATITIGQNGTIGRANGTSFSSPFLTGLISSLWSINPDLHRSEVIRIVKESADRYHAPDTVYGSGIPDFEKAVAEILKTLPTTNMPISEKSWRIASSSDGNAYIVSLQEPPFTLDSYSISLLDEKGKVVEQLSFEEEASLQIPISPELKKENRFFHLVINEPFIQKTFRIEL